MADGPHLYQINGIIFAAGRSFDSGSGYLLEFRFPFWIFVLGFQVCVTRHFLFAATLLVNGLPPFTLYERWRA
jgi:hypothetical protein